MKNAFFLHVFLVLFANYLFGTNLNKHPIFKSEKHHIWLSGSVDIKASKEFVFEFISDFCNDSIWRDEVNRTIKNYLPQDSGKGFIEYTKLSKYQSNHPLPFYIKEEIKDSLIIAETTDNSDFWERSIRQVTLNEKKDCHFIYSIEFDESILAFALGYRMPNFILKPYLIHTTRKYLHHLKNIIEKSK